MASRIEQRGLEREETLKRKLISDSRYIAFLNPATQTALIVPYTHSGIVDQVKTYLKIYNLLLTIDVMTESLYRKGQHYFFENIFYIYEEEEGLEISDSLARKFFQLFVGVQDHNQGLYSIDSRRDSFFAGITHRIGIVFNVTPRAKKAMDEYYRKIGIQEQRIRSSGLSDADLEQYIDNLYLSLPAISGSEADHEEDDDEDSLKRTYAEMYHGIGSTSFEAEHEIYEEVPDYELPEYYAEGEKYTEETY